MQVAYQAQLVHVLLSCVAKQNSVINVGATQINITVKEGGNKLLQIQDNGSGVQVSHSVSCKSLYFRSKDAVYL